MQKWSPEYEMGYWDKISKGKYLEQLKRKYDKLEVEKFVKGPVGVAVDIGGGMYGGVFNFLKGSWVRIIVDLLAHTFFERGTLPFDVVAIDADFASIPLPTNYADVVFALEVFDHANSVKQLKSGIRESVRILKPGGLFFMHHIFRDRPIEGHIVCELKEADILALLDENCEQLKKSRSGNEVYVVCRKVTSKTS